MTTTETTRDTAHPGRTKIAPRALDRVVSAVTADTLGVTAKNVSVDLADDGGSLSLTVSTPIRVPSLDRVQNGDDVVARTGGSVLDRAKAAQETIRTRVQALTGSTITRVIVTITGIDIKQERRVK
ncbi:hypothetical protein F1C15_15610 (plasmid) [Frigoribacterium sp. NBH87]|uniref:hypothetical protein n=1 Tax=Frigoribacterium sp. NBH87 TaxID=2596916 RepID=UPI001628D6E9|nr:hypothetical protein [Frigoribacterium sp. NBH87]QNE45399.1 hypothetical protein F1C15_15610 [Frigoribacterium sp. NBH87]